MELNSSKLLTLVHFIFGLFYLRHWFWCH